MGGWRNDPGECLICGAAHCSCGGGPIEVAQLPQRDAAAAAELARVPLQAEIVQASLPTGQVTSGTYRREKKPR